MDQWVKLITVEGEIKARLLAAFLNSEGIKTELRTHVPPSVYPILVDGLAEVQIWVAKEDLPQAEAALKAYYLGGE